MNRLEEEGGGGGEQKTTHLCLFLQCCSAPLSRYSSGNRQRVGEYIHVLNVWVGNGVEQETRLSAWSRGKFQDGYHSASTVRGGGHFPWGLGTRKTLSPFPGRTLLQSVGGEINNKSVLMLVQQGCRFDYCRILINGTISIYMMVKAAVRKMNRSAVESEHLCFSCTLVRRSCLGVSKRGNARDFGPSAR